MIIMLYNLIKIIIFILNHYSKIENLERPSRRYEYIETVRLIKMSSLIENDKRVGVLQFYTKKSYVIKRG